MSVVVLIPLLLLLLLLHLLLLHLLILSLVDFSGEIKQTARRRTTKCKHKYKYKYFSNNNNNNNKATWKICEKKIKTLQHDNNNNSNKQQQPYHRPHWANSWRPFLKLGDSSKTCLQLSIKVIEVQFFGELYLFKLLCVELLHLVVVSNWPCR